MTNAEQSLQLHAKLRGKLTIDPKTPLKNPSDLALLYTPGVAEPCRKIHKNKEEVFTYTGKGNLVAVVTDGSAVLGLGNIGPEAGLPVMEGKSLLFKVFGGVDSIPLCLDTQDTQEIIRTVEILAPGFGGINLEDIAAPRCFEIEEALKARLSIPVFHDDQHGTAIVTLAGLIGALKITARRAQDCKVVISGGGSAGTAISKMLLAYGFRHIVVCDRFGAMIASDDRLTSAQQVLASLTNPYLEQGSLSEVLQGADIFIGVSVPNILNPIHIQAMAPNPIVFAMANPDPEILPAEALAGGAKVVATGRSDFPNQINNVLAFPGIFRGALDVRALEINEPMKLAAAIALSSLVTNDDLSKGIIIPGAFHPEAALRVALATAQTAIKTGCALRPLAAADLETLIRQRLGLAE